MVALILGSYFEALTSWTAIARAEPQVQAQRCEAEAKRFLAMLRTVPSRRQRLADEREERLRQSGLLVFPTSTDQGDAP